MQQPQEIVKPKVHDLLKLRPDSLNGACIGAPAWVRQSLSSCPWAVVRRAQGPPGQIAVGVRGPSRNERWGSFLSTELIDRVVTPMDLLTVARASTSCFRTPAFEVLQQLMERWCDFALPWGPTGSVGFELATGCLATTSQSDLDIAIRAETRISLDQARWICERATGLPRRVDTRVETPECGFSLEEYARGSSTILLRYSEEARFGNDPWAKDPRAMESTP